MWPTSEALRWTPLRRLEGALFPRPFRESVGQEAAPVTGVQPTTLVIIAILDELALHPGTVAPMRAIKVITQRAHQSSSGIGVTHGLVCFIVHFRAPVFLGGRRVSVPGGPFGFQISIL